MADGPHDNQYDENFEGDYSQQNQHSGQFERERSGGSEPRSLLSDGGGPRKAIPRKQPVPAQTDIAPQDLDYGIHLEDEDEQGYKEYAPPPSASSLRKRQSKRDEKIVGGSDENPVRTLLFQFASIMPGMRLEDRSSKRSDTRAFESDSGTRSASDVRSGGNASGPKQSAPGRSALDNLASRTEYGGDGKRSNRDLGSLEQSAISKFMEKIFGSQDDYSSVQEVEAPEQKRKRTLIRAGVMVAIVGLIAVFYQVLPRVTQINDKYPRQYRSLDREKSFKLLDGSTAIYAIGTDTTKTPVKFFMGDWRDYFDVIFASPFQKQIYLVNADQSVKDLENNFSMFEARSPESVLSNEVQQIAERVGKYWEKDHTYPTTAEAVGKYFNPFDEREHLVKFKNVTEGNSKSGDDVEKEKMDLYRELIFARAKMEAAKVEPGTIACFNVKFIAAHQNLNVFVIKPYGKDAQALIGGHSDAQYFVSLEDGKPKDLLTAKPLSEWIGKAGMRPLNTIVLANQLDAISLLLLKHGAKLIFTLLAFGSLGFVLSVKKGDSPVLWIIILVLTAVPAVLALFGNFIP